MPQLKAAFAVAEVKNEVNVMIVVQSRDSDDPLAGFGHGVDLYMLAMRVDSRLDDAIYDAAHPDAPDATGKTHQDVLNILRDIAKTQPLYRDIAKKVADDYAQRHNLA